MKKFMISLAVLAAATSTVFANTQIIDLGKNTKIKIESQGAGPIAPTLAVFTMNDGQHFDAATDHSWKSSPKPGDISTTIDGKTKASEDMYTLNSYAHDYDVNTSLYIGEPDAHVPGSYTPYAPKGDAHGLMTPFQVKEGKTTTCYVFKAPYPYTQPPVQCYAPQ